MCVNIDKTSKWLIGDITVCQSKHRSIKTITVCCFRTNFSLSCLSEDISSGRLDIKHFCIKQNFRGNHVCVCQDDIGWTFSSPAVVSHLSLPHGELTLSLNSTGIKALFYCVLISITLFAVRLDWRLRDSSFYTPFRWFNSIIYWLLTAIMW